MQNKEGAGDAGKPGTSLMSGVGEPQLEAQDLRGPPRQDTSHVLGFVAPPAPTTASASARATPEQQPPASEPQSRFAVLDDHAQARLGQKLRAMFEDVANEPVPERLLDLLDALDQQDQRR